MLYGARYTTIGVQGNTPPYRVKYKGVHDEDSKRGEPVHLVSNRQKIDREHRRPMCGMKEGVVDGPLMHFSVSLILDK